MATSLAVRAAGPPAGEHDHFLECPVCGQTLDMRDLGQALDHWHDGPADDGSGPACEVEAGYGGLALVGTTPNIWLRRQ